MTTLVGRRGLAKVAGAIGCLAALGLSDAASARAADAATVIGVSIPTLDNPFWVRAVGFADHVGSVLNLTLVTVGAENSEEKQLADVQSLLARGVKALVVTPQSTASAPGLIKLANRANVPIVIVDRYPGFPANEPAAPYVAFIGPDDVTAGKSIIDYLISHGAKNIVGLGGTPGSSVADGREKGLKEGLASGGAKLIQYIGAGESEDAGYAAMQNILVAHPKGTVDGVWCFNDALCLGAFRAVQQSGRQNEIMLGGMDLVPQALDLIEKKTDYVFSTGGHWLEVGFGVMMAYDKLHGHNPINTDIRLSLIGVNGSNFAAFKQQFIDSPPPYDVKQYTLTNNPQATAQTFPLQTK
jgi:ABC-type sugar transport system substrate-binding protein